MNKLNNQYKTGLFKSFVLFCSYSWLLVFVLMPLLIVFGISLSQESYGRLPFEFFIKIFDGKLSVKPNIDNFIEIIEDQIFYNSLLKSLKLAVISTVICFIIGYPIAYSIYLLRSVTAKNILLLMIIVPFWTSLLIRIYSWIVLLQNGGLINKLLLSIGVINKPIEFLTSEVGVIIGIVYTYFPFMVIPIYSSLQKIAHSVHEAAEDLGAKPLRVFWMITFPQSISGVVAGSILVFIPAMGEYIIPDLLGGGNVLTLGKLLWTQFFYNRDWLMSSAISIIIIFIIVVPFYFFNKLLGRHGQ